MKFYDREKEWELLTRLFKSNAAFVVLYGRRRIGKTRLVREFLKGRDHLYLFIPDDKEESALVDEWKDSINEVLGYVPDVSTIAEIVKYLFETKRDLILFFDEFQNILKVNPGSISLLQRYVDLYKEEKNMFIIACGSYVGMMKKIFQNNKSPLFNRADVLLNLKPLSMACVFEILGDINIKDTQEKIKLFSVFGGVPKYYEILKKQGIGGFDDALRDMFIFYPATLRDEGRNILINEFGNRYKIYFSILESIALGKNSLSDIANFVGKERTSLMKYIIDLQREYNIVVREVPITEKRSDRSKRGIYTIKDPLFRFWFRFLHRNYSYFERDMEEYVYDLVRRDINSFLGQSFENISREFLSDLNGKERLPFRFQKIGRWWYRDMEIDLVALNEETKEIGFFEVKWASLSQREAIKILEELKERSRSVKWHPGDRKEFFGIIAKRINGKEKLRDDGLFCYDLEDLETQPKIL